MFPPLLIMHALFMLWSWSWLLCVGEQIGYFSLHAWKQTNFLKMWWICGSFHREWWATRVQSGAVTWLFLKLLSSSCCGSVKWVWCWSYDSVEIPACMLFTHISACWFLSRSHVSVKSTMTKRPRGCHLWMFLFFPPPFHKKCISLAAVVFELVMVVIVVCRWKRSMTFVKMNILGWRVKMSTLRKILHPMCPLCLFLLCFMGAVSNRGRHDRVGKARERARGKGTASKAHPAGARGPGARHRSKQVWALLRRRLPSAGLAPHSLTRPEKHQSNTGDLHRSDAAAPAETSNCSQKHSAPLCPLRPAHCSHIAVKRFSILLVCMGLTEGEDARVKRHGGGKWTKMATNSPLSLQNLTYFNMHSELSWDGPFSATNNTTPLFSFLRDSTFAYYSTQKSPTFLCALQSSCKNHIWLWKFEVLCNKM